MMEKGISDNTSYVLRYIAERKDEVNSYIDEIVKKSYVSFETEDEIFFLLDHVLNSFLEELNLEEQQDLRRYTGLEFREINAVLRNCWNYEVNGKLTEGLKEKYILLAEKIRKIFVKAKPLPIGINTYRGVSLLAFQSYGIFKLTDLIYLKNQSLYEEGFISTSLIKKKSFYYNNPFTLTGKPN